MWILFEDKKSWAQTFPNMVEIVFTLNIWTQLFRANCVDTDPIASK